MLILELQEGIRRLVQILVDFLGKLFDFDYPRLFFGRRGSGRWRLLAELVANHCVGEEFEGRNVAFFERHLGQGLVGKVAAHTAVGWCFS